MGRLRDSTFSEEQKKTGNGETKFSGGESSRNTAAQQRAHRQSSPPAVQYDDRFAQQILRGIVLGPLTRIISSIETLIRRVECNTDIEPQQRQQRGEGGQQQNTEYDSSHSLGSFCGESTVSETETEGELYMMKCRAVRNFWFEVVSYLRSLTNRLPNARFRKSNNAAEPVLLRIWRGCRPSRTIHVRLTSFHRCVLCIVPFCFRVADAIRNVAMGFLLNFNFINYGNAVNSIVITVVHVY